jgi:hypothetical protein
MAGESGLHDLKLDFDLSNEKAKIDLVKNLVAISNTGGGEIIFGRDEIKVVGVSDQLISELDSAKVSDLVKKFTDPAQVNIQHDVIMEGGLKTFRLIVDGSEYPLVMSRDGNWNGQGKETALFRKGDIWIRHSTKTERVTYEDVRLWIERAKKLERDNILQKLTTYVNAPEGAELLLLSEGGAPLDSPERILKTAILRNDRDQNHLLSSNELLWVFVNRSSYRPNERELRLLISSALRRPATLYWWLFLADSNPKTIVEEITKVFNASDRDKSDAARSVIELASIYMGDFELAKVLENLKTSKYSHFREIQTEWEGRELEIQRIKSRVNKAKFGDELLLEFSTIDLEVIAEEFARESLIDDSSQNSRKLSDVFRVIWAKTTTIPEFQK